MKKIVLIIFISLLLFRVKALDITPENIYYSDNGLYAYLEVNDIVLPSEEAKLYVEYRLTNDEITKNIELIEVPESSSKILILEENDDFFSKTLEVEARYVLVDNEYDYSEWTDKEAFKTFKFDSIPTPKISNLTTKFEYDFNNIKDIEEYFKDYSKVNDFKIEYIQEYKVNDGEWSKAEPKNLDFDDIKIEFRIKYKMGEYESEYSNILNYEKHPEKVCPFGSDICCYQVGGLSICYLVLIICAFITILLIFIDKKKQMNREA